jgi:phosphoribosylglycinamide formyltransferase-1
MVLSLPEKLPRCRMVVLISGNGSNLQAIIDACHDGHILGDIVAVISNESSAYGLDRAKNAGIETVTLPHKDFPTRADYDHALSQRINGFEPDLIVLAGFMRILTADTVCRYRGQIINIHPSILPLYPGLNTHERALEDQVSTHGATVHFVTEALDGGPIILQGRVKVLDNDSKETLAAKVHVVEHQIYPKVISWFSTGRLRMKQGTVLLDGNPINLRIESND